MAIEKFIKEKSSDIKVVIIDQLDETFNSHQFIESFAKKFESDYIKFLSKYDSHKTVHSHIALGLAKCADEFGITKSINDVVSRSVFGNDVPNKQWKK